MGHCSSKEEKEARKRNRKIEEQMKKDQSMSLRTIKLLLLGKKMIKYQHEYFANVNFCIFFMHFAFCFGVVFGRARRPNHFQKEN